MAPPLIPNVSQTTPGVSPAPAEPPRTETLCFSCNVPETKNEDTATACFTLEPIPGAEAEDIDKLLAVSMRMPTSLLIAQFPIDERSGAPIPSRMYTISALGSPLHTDTLADLCTGAPFFWNPRTITIASSALLTQPYSALHFLTADGVSYSAYFPDAATQSTELIYSGTRTDIPATLALDATSNEHVQQELDDIAGFNAQMSTPPMFVTPHQEARACTNPFDSNAAQYSSDTVSDMAPTTFCYAANSDLPILRQLEIDFAAVRALYPAPGRALTLEYVPAPHPGAFAEAFPADTEPSEQTPGVVANTIRVYGTFFSEAMQPEYHLASPQAQQLLRGALLSHELGHIYLSRFGAQDTDTDDGYAAAYGLPSATVYAAYNYLAKQQLSNHDIEAQLWQFAAAQGTPNVTSAHAPGVTELMAYLYESDFLIRNTTPDDRQEAAVQAAYQHLEDNISDSKWAITRSLSLYPESVYTVNQLHHLILFNPHFTAETKQLGVGILADIVNQIAPEAREFVLHYIAPEAGRCMNPGFAMAGLDSTRKLYLHTGYMADAERCDLESSIHYVGEPEAMVKRYTLPLIQREDRAALDAYFAQRFPKHQRPRKPAQ